MTKATIVTFCIFFCECVQSASYNQRQTGELNVQLDLNDIQIIALMKGKEDYVEYDYAYDYSEMTIKPPAGTKPKPLNHTSTVTVAIKDNSTTTPITHTPSETSTTEIVVPYVTTDSITSTSDSITTTLNIETVAPSSPSTTVSNDCRQGFVKNDKGLCEFNLHNASNRLKQMVRLSQKLKRREN